MSDNRGRLAAALRRWTPRRILFLLLSLVLPAVIFFLRPFSLTVSQAAVTAFLLLTVIWWVTKLVDRTIASLVLLLAFCLFGNTPIKSVFSFPLSETFVLIILSFLFSEGVKNSGLLDKLLLPLLTRWANSAGKVLCSMLVVNLAMIFIIPQPFSRIILAAMIYDRFFRLAGMEDGLRQCLLFCLHSSSIAVNMAFLRGDLILNNALLSISGVPISELEWMRCMALPSLLFAALGLAASRLIFRGPLSRFPAVAPVPPSPWTKVQRRNLIVLLAVILLWATEDLHGISGTIIVCVGTAAMVPLGLLRLNDLRCVDLKLLVFLTAAFSIGSVMKLSGTAGAIFSQFTPLFPAVFSPLYLLIILVVCMIMHMILGSSITTLSVVVPSLLIIGAGVVPTEVLLFSIYIMACSHCLLPFHNVITMIGEGRGYFSGKDLARYGLAMTVPTILFVLAVFYGWWTVIGVT